MNDREVLFSYRKKQAEDTLQDARKMLQSGIGPKSIVNRAYYALFYATLALFLKNNIDLKTSKHSGVIALFDKEFVHSGRIDKEYSKILHRVFEIRQESDYKELFEISSDEAYEIVQLAEKFLQVIF